MTWSFTLGQSTGYIKKKKERKKGHEIKDIFVQKVLCDKRRFLFQGVGWQSLTLRLTFEYSVKRPSLG